MFEVFDINDKNEYWNYLCDKEMPDKGLLYFIENLYKDYTVREMDQKPLSEITTKIRENLLNLANRICGFTDKYGTYIKEDT